MGLSVFVSDRLHLRLSEKDETKDSFGSLFPEPLSLLALGGRFVTSRRDAMIVDWKKSKVLVTAINSSSLTFSIHSVLFPTMFAIRISFPGFT
jgi:hypothetical protein